MTFFTNIKNRILNSIADRVAKVLQDDSDFTGSVAESVTEERSFERELNRAIDAGVDEYMRQNSLKVEADDVEGLNGAISDGVENLLRDGELDEPLATAVLELIENNDKFANKIRELLAKKETPAEVPAQQ